MPSNSHDLFEHLNRHGFIEQKVHVLGHEDAGNDVLAAAAVDSFEGGFEDIARTR